MSNLLNKHQQLPFWLLTISVMLALTLPVLIQDGMFMDAMLYTSVSHNLSLGIGTFWHPQFSLYNIAGLKSFHEQPPLVFGIQALFFKVLGDSMYIERLYTFLTMLITSFLINKLWKEIFKEHLTLLSYGWLPIILWITIPVCFWSYSNNMHENTMGIFSLSAVLIYYKNNRSGNQKFSSLVLVGFFVFLATLSKGIPGFFPVTIPFLYWLSINRFPFKTVVYQTLIITLTPVFIYLVLLLFPEANDSLTTYFFKRVLYRINDVPTVDNRFYILLRLLLELLPQIIITIIILFFIKTKATVKVIAGNKKLSFFFISVGIISSLPLMLTLVQKGFYFVPSLPFFAIGLSILIAPKISELIDKININSGKYKLFFLITTILFFVVSSFGVMQKGKYSREKVILEDVYAIGSIVPKLAVVSIPNSLWNDWSLQCYLARYYSISLEPNELMNFYIVEKNGIDTNLTCYQKVNLKTQKYDLYKKIN